ncbi:putative fungal fucose-specific lectin protein [Neofusicoccum parvum UCRNP2]|uniref:Putative fungal fucose-specific lectin protein n=1 Tax=Botryosphaeria parva (strain UCR-NP2) TaxID=1287680 RepID=R1EJW8_BOTPV|nr:putative fungal fucose-specific lectin protein [Neofusicoccum parvum UCRNP2]
MPYRQGVAANSRLAANNYTDASGVVHSQLYYQDNSLDIWNADFNNSTNRWSLAPVRADNNRTDMTPKNGTPIAAGNWWHDNNDGLADFRVFWVDGSSMIRAVFVLNESIATSGWSTLSQLDAWIPVDATSQLVEYLPMCNQNTTCNSADFVGFESPNSEGVRLQWPFANGDNGRLVADGGVPADAGTAMAVAPIPEIAKRNDSYPTVALYLVGGGALVELRGGAGAQLAALSQYREDDYNVQVLMSQTNGGVKMAYMNGDGWNSTDSVEADNWFDAEF